MNTPEVPKAFLLAVNKLNRPEFPKVTEEERAAFAQRMSDVATQAEQGFAVIEGLKVYNLMKSIGHASIGGTAEAVVKALELDCVKDGVIGNRLIFRTIM